MRTFVLAVVLFNGFFGFIKVVCLALPDQKQRGMTAIDALLTIAVFVWGLVVLVSN